MAKTRRVPRDIRTAVKLLELGFAAPLVVAHRVARLGLAGLTPGARDQKEFFEMVAEKQLAFAQAWMAMVAEGLRLQQQFFFAALSGAGPRETLARTRSAMPRLASRVLAPIHRKAVSNARRLARTKLR